MKRYTLPSINKKVETVILANGKFPEHEIALAILDNCTNLVSCDGATNKLVQTNRIPLAIVGDCDSLTDENKEKFASRIRYVTEQETNDLTKAVNYCVEKGWKDIIILGATGEREDHTIGNISLLCEYMQIADVKMVTDYGVFVAINKTSTFDSYKGQQVSLFCLDSSPLTVEGLVYKIENKSFNRWWQATLNEAESSQFSVKTEGMVIVYRELQNN